MNHQLIMNVQHDLTLPLTHLHLQTHLQTTLERQPATTRPPNMPHEIMLADIGMTILLGTVQPTTVEIAVPPIAKATLEISTVKAKLVLAPRHTTTPDLAGKHFTLEEYLANCRLFRDSDPVSLVALPDSFGVTMLLPTFGIDATSSIKRSLNRCMLMVLEFCGAFDFHLTFHTPGLFIMFHTFLIARHLRITFSPYRSFQLANRAYFDLSPRGSRLHHGVPGFDLPV